MLIEFVYYLLHKITMNLKTEISTRTQMLNTVSYLRILKFKKRCVFLDIVVSKTSILYLQFL